MATAPAPSPRLPRNEVSAMALPSASMRSTAPALPACGIHMDPPMEAFALKVHPEMRTGAPEAYTGAAETPPSHQVST